MFVLQLQVFPIGDDKHDVPPESVIKARHALIQDLQYKPRVPHGTSYYCAPEVIRLATRTPCGSSYSYLCDYWSLGVCFYYLIFKKLPFFSDEKVQVQSITHTHTYALTHAHTHKYTHADTRTHTDTHTHRSDDLDYVSWLQWYRKDKAAFSGQLLIQFHPKRCLHRVRSTFRSKQIY